ncbi:dTDP-4-dehydrorhamnose reductase [Patescibacteria group bacterium]|nr:dTDP-4-dehydrorhamnose reductase [Patescibacteria group bacterium]
MKAMILGGQGMLGQELLSHLSANGEAHGYDRADFDVLSLDAVLAKAAEIKPDVIFNCVGYNAVDKAENDDAEKAMAFALNQTAVENLVKAARAHDAVLVHYSTGYVFDGEKSEGYAESDAPNPLSVYAQSKLAGEQAALEYEKSYVVRLNLLFGKPAASQAGKKSFPEIILQLAAGGQKEFSFITDEISTPTYAKDLAEASAELAESGKEFGIYHLPNSGQASWYEFAAEVFKIKGVDVQLKQITADQYRPVRPAKRPKNSVLLNTKLASQRPWQEALKEFLSTI